MKDLIALIARLVAIVGEFNAPIVTDLATKAFDLGYKEGREKEAEVSHRRMLPDLGPVMRHVADGQKIQAIKELRIQVGKDPATGYSSLGLKEAKDYVEMLSDMWANGILPK